uniref:Uncharacterized protein n=1 Tax=Nelumbo nucifera TaxID=4432 RepID=A0A822ZLB1_NELNU|nr:TPA_asm: hypothetical protein HUJ06_004201 [Nelumbo nucifera]
MFEQRGILKVSHAEIGSSMWFLSSFVMDVLIWRSILINEMTCFLLLIEILILMESMMIPSLNEDVEKLIFMSFVLKTYSCGNENPHLNDGVNALRNKLLGDGVL